MKNIPVRPCGHPAYQENADVAKKNGETPCALCGRGSLRYFTVRVIEEEGETRFATPEEAQLGTSAPVGETCAKLIRFHGFFIEGVRGTRNRYRSSR